MDGYYPERSDSQRRLNPDLANQDVQLNAPAVPVPASGTRYNDVKRRLLSHFYMDWRTDGC